MILPNVRRWVNWSLRDGRKIPVAAGGYAVDRHNRSHWKTFAEAAAVSNRIGLVLGQLRSDRWLLGYDADDCVANGSVADDVVEIVSALDSYTEITPSGRGVHVIVGSTAPLPPHGRRKGRHEFYDDQFFTFTGDHVPGTPTDVQRRTPDEIATVHARIFGPQDALRPPSVRDEPVPSYIVQGDTRGTEHLPAPPPPLTDEQVIDHARHAANADKFRLLWQGYWRDAGYTSQSEADLALCRMLAFWTMRDRAQMDRLFRQSGLLRSKWDQRRGDCTYGERQILLAVQHTSDVYVPLPVIADMSNVIDLIGEPKW